MNERDIDKTADDNHEKSQNNSPVEGVGRTAIDEELSLALGFDQEDLLALATSQMPFGKYAGRPLITLPEEYLFWFRKHGFPNDRLGKLMALCLELKIEGLDGLLMPLVKSRLRS